MSNKQLPPELVEKMYSITSGRPIEKITGTDHLKQDLKYGGQYSKQAIECAQIAVDYSQPFKDELLKWVGLHEEKDQYAKLIEKQRDELVDASNDIIEGFNHLLIETGNQNKATDFTFVRRYLELLKKHKDGKE